MRNEGKGRSQASMNNRGERSLLPHSGPTGLAAAVSAGIRLIASASMIQVQPAKSISSPTSRPITHTASSGSADK